MTLEKIVSRAALLGLPALALTDDDNLYGAVTFYRLAKAKGIHPIIGVELSLPNAALSEDDSKEEPKEDDDDRRGKRSIVLLAKNQLGYENLCHLITLKKLGPSNKESAQKNGVENDTENDTELRWPQDFLEHSAGLLVLCDSPSTLKPIVDHLNRLKKDQAQIDQAQKDQAKKTQKQAKTKSKTVTNKAATNKGPQLTRSDLRLLWVQPGEGHDHQSREVELFEASKKWKIPLIADPYIAFLDPEDHDLHRLKLAISNNTWFDRVSSKIKQSKDSSSGSVGKPDNSALPRIECLSKSRYFPSPRQWRERFKNYPKALIEAQRLIQLCQLDLTREQPIFPNGSLQSRLTASRASELLSVTSQKVPSKKHSSIDPHSTDSPLVECRSVDRKDVPSTIPSPNLGQPALSLSTSFPPGGPKPFFSTLFPIGESSSASNPLQISKDSDLETSTAAGGREGCPFTLLTSQAFSGLYRRNHKISPQHLSRLTYELDIIQRLGFTTYFLIVGDIVLRARQRGIEVIGRGSGASSLVAYALGVTNVDPITYGLHFERFLHEGRKVDLPDVDIDLCWIRRDEVIDDVYEAYGHEKVAMISTHVTFQPRSAFRETLKAFGLSVDSVNRLSKFLPSSFGPSSLSLPQSHQEARQEARQEAHQQGSEEEGSESISHHDNRAYEKAQERASLVGAPLTDGNTTKKKLLFSQTPFEMRSIHLNRGLRNLEPWTGKLQPRLTGHIQSPILRDPKVETLISSPPKQKAKQKIWAKAPRVTSIPSSKTMPSLYFRGSPTSWLCPSPSSSWGFPIIFRSILGASSSPIEKSMLTSPSKKQRRVSSSPSTTCTRSKKSAWSRSTSWAIAA